MAGVGRATAARWGRHDLQTGKPALELERLGQAAKVEAHEAMIENSRRGFAGIKQDRIYRETDISLAVKPPAAPPRQQEPVVVDADPVEVRAAAEPSVVPLRPLSEQYQHLIPVHRSSQTYRH